MRLRRALLCLIGLCILGLSFGPAALLAQRSEGNASCSFHSSATAAGNGTACEVLGYTLLAVQVSGTVAGATMVPEGSMDGTNYNSLLCMDVPGLTFGVPPFTALSTNYCKITGYRLVRVRVASVSGTTSVSVAGTALMGTFATNLP